MLSGVSSCTGLNRISVSRVPASGGWANTAVGARQSTASARYASFVFKRIPPFRGNGQAIPSLREAGGRPATESAEGDLVVDLGQRQLGLDGGEGEDGVQALGSSVEPASSLAYILLQDGHVLGDQDDLGNGFETLVPTELPASAVGLG